MSKIQKLAAKEVDKLQRCVANLRNYNGIYDIDQLHLVCMLYTNIYYRHRGRAINIYRSLDTRTKNRLPDWAHEYIFWVPE